MNSEEEKEILLARITHLNMLISAAKKRGDRVEVSRLQIELEVAEAELIDIE